MRDLRHHPLVLFVELNLLFGLGAILLLHVVGPRRSCAAGERAFAAPVMTRAAPPSLRLHEGAVVDVAAEIDKHGVVAFDDAGGRATQTTARFASHIFRKNPSDRGDETAATPGDDYFLEDAFEPLAADALEDGRDPFRATLAPGGNHRVYLIDGNLWVHNHHALSFTLAADDGPARVTFLVMGDIYFLDSFFYGSDEDAVLFAAVPGRGGQGGSIWLGDTGYGTLAHIDGWLYAAKDILGDTLDRPTVVHGALAAGRHIDVRDDAAAGRRLVVDFDPRLVGGRGWVPGL